MTHTPTRVDIHTEGWTSGTDMPLPKNCQTATCHHKEHQLKGEWSFGDGMRAGESSGWVAMSSVFTQPTRTHKEFHKRNWFKRGYQPQTGWLNVLCSDTECEKEHITTPAVPLSPLDMPTVSIRRGGLRFYPEFPECAFHIIRRGMRWQIEVRYPGTQTWHKPPQLRYWRKKTVESVRAWFMSHQQGMRAIYIERANAR